MTTMVIRSGYRVVRGLGLYAAPLFLWILTAFTVLASTSLDEKNIGVVFYLVIPIVFTNTTARMLTMEYHGGFWEVVSTYPQSKRRLFWTKYLISSCLSIGAAFVAYLLTTLGKQGEGSMIGWLVESVSAGFLIGNIGGMLAVLYKSYELGFIGGLVALAAISRFSLPHSLYIWLLPLLTAASAVWLSELYGRKNGVE